MDLAQYQQAAMRTANMDLSQELILANRALGLAGEASEFSAIVFRKLVFGDSMTPVEVTKELGDVMWYAATTADAVGLDLASVRDNGETARLVGLTLEKLTIGLNVATGEIADHIKKHTTHGHGLDQGKVSAGLAGVLFFVDKLAALTGAGSIEDVCTQNVEKLRKRYPDGFDPKRSQARAISDS